MMGVDITAIAQVKENRAWKTVASNIIDFRDYKLFHLIGGEYASLIPPRGLPKDLKENDIPKDLSIFFIGEHWVGGLEDGWLTLEELYQIMIYAIENKIDCFYAIKDIIVSMTKIKEKYTVLDNDIRVVWVFSW